MVLSVVGICRHIMASGTAPDRPPATAGGNTVSAEARLGRPPGAPPQVENRPGGMGAHHQQ
jgi:hypothetical protein